MKIDKQLVEKYNQPVPRYTSYPPANFFTDEYTSEDYLVSVEESNNQTPENISIYIHIPFCKKLCFYCGCNSMPMAKEDTIESYVKALKKEMEIVFARLDKNRKVSQIHYGGGTPNAIDCNYLQELNSIVFNTFDLIEKPEIAIECQPAYLTEEYINGLAKAGFNRISLGIQDFEEQVLKNVNRDSAGNTIGNIIKTIKNQGDISINFDFIYGLPGQSADSFKKTIQQAISLKPDRLVTFSYAHVPWVNKAQTALEKIGLPGSNNKIDMFEAAYNLLLNSDYKAIGLDHFVLETDELYRSQQEGQLHRNFQGYCTRQTTGQVYAFGVSGISQLYNSYAQNTKDIKEYINQLEHSSLPIIKGYKLNQEELKTRALITQLMCNKQVELPKNYNTNNEQLNQLVTDNIIELNGRTLKVTENGGLFLRNVASLFDPLIAKKGKAFSKTV